MVSLKTEGWLEKSEQVSKEKKGRGQGRRQLLDQTGLAGHADECRYYPKVTRNQWSREVV